MTKIPHFRWYIIVLVFLAAVLNYVDRQTLSALAPTIQRDLAMDDRDYANIVNLFLVAHTIAYLVSKCLTGLIFCFFAAALIAQDAAPSTVGNTIWELDSSTSVGPRAS